MTATKRIAHKIELFWDEAGGTNFEKLCNIKKITGVGFELDEVELTCLDDDVDQSAPSPVVKLSDVELQLFWDDGSANHQAFEDMICNPPAPAENPTDYPSFQRRFPFATPITKTWHGWLKALPGTEYEVKNDIMRDATINVNTKPVTA